MELGYAILHSRVVHTECPVIWRVTRNLRGWHGTSAMVGSEAFSYSSPLGLAHTSSSFFVAFSWSFCASSILAEVILVCTLFLSVLGFYRVGKALELDVWIFDWFSSMCSWMCLMWKEGEERSSSCCCQKCNKKTGGRYWECSWQWPRPCSRFSDAECWAATTRFD